MLTNRPLAAATVACPLPPGAVGDVWAPAIGDDVETVGVGRGLPDTLGADEQPTRDSDNANPAAAASSIRVVIASF